MTLRLKKILLILAVFGGLIIVWQTQRVLSSSHTNVTGWLWSGTTDDSLGTPSLDTITGLGWVHIASTTNYGLSIPEAAGCNSGCPITDYTWSSQLGWIYFRPTGDFNTYSTCGYPTAPCRGVERFLDSFDRVNPHKLRGWARICSAVDDAASLPDGDCAGPPHSAFGGYEGWIKFSTGPKYTGQIDGVSYNGVVIEPDTAGTLPAPYTHRLKGHAWSSELGWIRFGGLPISINPAPTDYPLASIGFQPPPPQTPYLISRIFDTCLTAPRCGAAINTVSWRGVRPSDSTVRFQVASSDCENGAANPSCDALSSCGGANCWDLDSDGLCGAGKSCFQGPAGSSSDADFYEPTEIVALSGFFGPAKINLSHHNNKRYVRYKAMLLWSFVPAQSPEINDIIINWSP